MCTRVLWNTNHLAVLTGRTMDWPASTEPLLTVFPRGQHRHGGQVGGKDVVAANPLDWTSTYGSLVTSVYGLGTADGMNERGLAAHMLYLQSTELPTRDPARPGLQIALWAQYLLDLAGTVDEALGLLDTFQPVMVESHGFAATVHLAIEDAGGDSAIIEYVAGQPVVHHGRQYTVMTNEPPYSEQLRLLAEQDWSSPSDDLPIPGNVNAVDRFQRASYFAELLPDPANDRIAAASILAIARNASVPFGAPYDKFGIYNTEYRTVCDSTNKRYFFELSTGPNVIWTDLDRLDFTEGAPVLTLDPDDMEMSGDVSDRYAAATVAF